MSKQGLRKEMMKKSVWVFGKDAACNHRAKGCLFIVVICKAYRKQERNAWLGLGWEWGSPRLTLTLNSQYKDQRLKNGLVFVLDILVVSLVCTDFSKYAFFSLSFLREAGHSA